MKLHLVISSFHHLSQFSLCSYELHSIVTCYNFGACLKGKESPENLDEFHCRDINGKIQMHSLCILACEYYSIVLTGFVMTYSDLEWSKIIACCIIEWGCPGHQAMLWQISHELWLNLMFHISA